MSEPRRLLDEFEAELRSRGLPSPGEIFACGVFGDLMWPPTGDMDLASRITVDPAFTITGYTRYVALARILDEIRFYASRIPEGAPAWWWSGEDPDRVAAVRAEMKKYEMSILTSVPDAVRFTLSYLAGTPLNAIEVIRIRPSASRYKNR